MTVLAVIIGALGGMHSAIVRAHCRSRAINESRIAASWVANRVWSGCSPGDAIAGCPGSLSIDYQPVLAGDLTNQIVLGKWTITPSNNIMPGTELYLHTDQF